MKTTRIRVSRSFRKPNLNSIAGWLSGAAGSLGLALGGCAAADPNPVSIDHIEVTQGIQTMLNQVPLVANKTTFVRVLVRANVASGTGSTSVGARLILDGLPAIEPIGVRTLVPSATGSDPRVLDEGFLFQLPNEATAAGLRSARVELVPADGAGAVVGANATISLRFGPSGAPPSLRFYGVRYGYHNVPTSAQAHLGLTSSVWSPLPFETFEAQRAGAEGMLPIASLSIDRLPDDPVGNFDCRFTGAPDNGGCAGYEDARPWAQALIDAAHPEGGAWIVVLQPERAGGHLGAYFASPRGNHVINFQADTMDIGSTLAHEIGHGLGLLHTFEDPNYPRPEGALGDFNALRATPTPELISGQDAAGNTTAFDTMAYSFRSWFSPYNYCRALAVTSGGRTLCPPRLDGWN